MVPVAKGRCASRRSHVARAGPVLPRPVPRETRAELAAARERAGVRVISITRCSQRRCTAFGKSPSPYPLPEYREREAAVHVRSLLIPLFPGYTGEGCAVGDQSRTSGFRG